MSEQQYIVHATDAEAAEPPLGASVGVAHSPREQRTAPHARKFRAAFLVLAAIAVAALLVAGGFLARHGTRSSAPWSSWHPPDSGSSAPREIADHLAPLYRISGVDQLAVVTVANITNSTAAAASSSSTSSQSSNGLQIAVRPDPNQSAVSLLSGSTVAFNLCGIGGTDCSIGVGTPSTDRLLLLRREALELALYTFKYDSGTQNVVALLPPGKTVQTSTLTAKPPSGTSASGQAAPLHLAILFVRDELKPFLSQPVAASLPLQFPPTLSQVKLWKSTQEAALVEQVTARGMFSQTISHAQDGSNLIVLSPLPPQ